MSPERKMIPLASIEVSESALRGVQSGSEKFEEIKASIASEGIIHNLTVRPSATAEGMYTLIDGLQRYTIAGMLGMEEVPVLVLVDTSEVKALLIQIQANIHNIDTKPAEYAKQLVRILRQGDMTAPELAAKLSKSTDWINARLGLLKLLPDIQKLVDNGTLKLANAKMLSALSEEEQKNWIGRAVNETAEVFIPAIKEHIAASKKSEREGKEIVEEVFVAVPRQRTKSEMIAELAKPTARNAMLTKDMTAAQAWEAALQWSMRLDPATIKESEEKWNAAKLARDARKEENKAAREAARAAKAAEVESKLI